MHGFESFPAAATEQREQPKALYHASPVAEIETLKPGARSVRDGKEGAVIFATPDKALATTFLFENHGGWAQMGKINNVPYILIAKDRDAFIQEDKGGVMYEMSPDGFSSDPHKGMGEDEWTRQGEVQPRSKEQYPSALDAMIDNGVQVYFVDQLTLERFQEDTDSGLFKELTSENQLRGMNVRSFDETDQKKL
jgi:hypothetical protein